MKFLNSEVTEMFVEYVLPGLVLTIVGGIGWAIRALVEKRKRRAETDNVVAEAKDKQVDTDIKFYHGLKDAFYDQGEYLKFMSDQLTQARKDLHKLKFSFEEDKFNLQNELTRLTAVYDKVQKELQLVKEENTRLRKENEKFKKLTEKNVPNNG